MRRLFLALLLSVISTLAVAQSFGPANFDWSKYDFDGDSRTRDIYPNTCNSGTEPVANCGTRGTNWFVIANALAGQRYKIGLVQAVAGQRSDQYLAQTNVAPMLTSNAGNFVIGYPAINDLTPLNGSSYVNSNGVTVTSSNVANVVVQSNILPVVRQAVARGKHVILLHEPGNPTISNAATGVSVFQASVSAFTMTVASISSGVIYTPQTVTVNGLTGQQQPDPGTQQLTGGGVTTGTLIQQQLTGTDGAACPAVNNPASALTSTCTGGVGTYLISASLSLSTQAMNGRYALLSAMSDINSMLDALVAAFPSFVQVINPNPALHNFGGVTTAVNFKAGINLDGDGTTNGTHFNALGGYYAAIAFNSQYQPPTPGTDFRVSLGTDISASNARSLIAANNLFLGSASGGTNSTCVLTNTVPTGYQTACGAGTTAITVSAPATDTNALYGVSGAIPLAGNALQIAITFGAADTFRFFPVAPNNLFWNLTDYLQGGYTVNVANGSSKCRVYMGIDFATNLGTRPTFSQFSADDVASGSPLGSVDGPTTAYSFVMATLPTQAAAAGTTKSFVRSVLYAQASAPGSCTVTISRPSFMRVRVYNPTTGTFSG